MAFGARRKKIKMTTNEPATWASSATASARSMALANQYPVEWVDDIEKLIQYIAVCDIVTLREVLLTISINDPGMHEWGGIEGLFIACASVAASYKLDVARGFTEAI